MYIIKFSVTFFREGICCCSYSIEHRPKAFCLQNYIIIIFTDYAFWLFANR